MPEAGHPAPAGRTIAVPHLRRAEADDAAAIAAIYAPYVLTHTATFEVEPPPADEMNRRRELILGGGMPYLVAEVGNEVVGYGYAGPYRPRAAYRFTVEDSIYLHPDWLGRGIGRQLLNQLVADSAASGFRQMIAVIGDSANSASVRLHASVGFAEVGTLRDVGYKFGRWLDTVVMQRALRADGNPR